MTDVITHEPRSVVVDAPQGGRRPGCGCPSRSRWRRIMRCQRRWPTRPSTRARQPCTSNSTRPTPSCGRRSATTGSAGPTPPGVPGWSGSATASRRSAARSKSPAHWGRHRTAHRDPRRQPE